MGNDVSVGGPCPPDCPICLATPTTYHDLTASQHTGEAPDGIMDLCPKCVEDDPNAYHYRGDWHRQMAANFALQVTCDGCQARFMSDQLSRPILCDNCERAFTLEDVK